MECNIMKLLELNKKLEDMSVDELLSLTEGYVDEIIIVFDEVDEHIKQVKINKENDINITKI